ncbi:MAG: PQQ-binding-like beta-propeller repeat protein [Bdellovibrionaceae bacterium]|nr:PQQ-binding-like beta-propeller repeat protein [Pseudobdellovibrionaceae bacterium]
MKPHCCSALFFIFVGMMTITGVSGCASLKSVSDTLVSPAASQRSLSLDRQWVRSTLDKEFLLFRRTHRMAPVFFGDLVIQGNAIDGVVAFDRKTGSQAWRLSIENGVEGGAQLVDGRLYFGASDGQFYAVNAENGSVLWTFPVRAETLAPPTVDGGVVYFQSGADLVFALNASTGKQLWLYNRQTTAQLSIRSTTRPTVDQNLIYAGFSDGFLVALSKQTGALQWEKKLSRNIRFNDVDSTPIIDGKTLYVSSYDGSLYALNKESGEILWELSEGGYTPVTLGRDVLYYSTTGGAVHALDKASGRKVWSIAVSRGIATQPSLMGSYLVFGESEGALVVADARTGSLLTRFEPGRGILAAPLTVESSNEVFFVSNNANLYAMKLQFHRKADRLPWQTQGH